MTRERGIAILQTISVLVLMSLGNVLSKRALATIPAFTFSWLTIGIGMLVLGGYTFGIRREPLPRDLSRRVWIYIIIIGLCNFVISRLGHNFALERLPATTKVYLGQFVGFVTMGMSIFILKEAPYVFQILGAVVAILGLRVYFLEIPPPDELIGVAILLVAIIATATSNNVARKLGVEIGQTLGNNTISAMALLIGGSLVVGFGLFTDLPLPLFTMEEWGIIFYEGIVRVGIALTVWNYILRTLRSYEASILGATTIIWTALLAIPILGETLAWNEITGIAMMLIGIGLVQVRKGQIRLFSGQALSAPSSD